MIYYRLSEFIFQQFILPRGVEEKYKSIYSYGLEVILSSCFNFIVLIILSVVLNVFTEMFCFILTFIPLRIYGGGAHASSHSKCLILFSISMIASIAIGTILSGTAVCRPIMLLGIICCTFIQYRFSKDKQKNLRYRKQELAKFAFPWVICLIAYLAVLAPIEPKYAVISVFGIYVQSTSLLIKNL
jgi:accessory gene regulator protein AgrB